MAEAALAQTTNKSRTSRRNTRISDLGADPLWYKDAVIYEAHVRAFHDSNGDGIGDFRGLTEKLDYLQELGITAIWLLPFYPSPLKDDGYDIADYNSINPIYGTLKDFKVFLQEAHRRHLRVITELVVNHTSDQHPWFQRSRRAKPGTAWRDFYVWSDTPDKYRDARIIFRDFEPSNWTWDPVAKAYFWHRFYSHQPDLNYDNPQVAREIMRALDFWLDMGVDGLRLDAVPYLYERENTSCENLSETHDYLKTLRLHVDQKYGDRMLLAEANQWPEDAVSYFGSGKGDECHMAFHFPLMPRIFMAVRMEDRVPIVDILQQTPAIPETSQWALFLRNHDELTLEMVTDEERDYMYRVYASQTKARINLGIRRRLAPLLGNDRKRIELLNMLLLSFPGAPVLYYGDEIGMGDNVFLGDRNGVRTPMQWSSDKNAGFSRASPQALYLPIILDPEYHYEAINVEAQQGNRHSLLWWMRRVLALRKRHRAFGRGTIQFLQPENRKILAFIRRYETETILVVANLSRFPQPVELELSEFKQTIPHELFGRTQFPRITETPYFLTLSPHAMFWFSLVPVAGHTAPSQPVKPAEPLVVSEDWEEILLEPRRASLESRVFEYLQNQPWFGGKGRQLKSVQIRDAIKLPVDAGKVFLLFLLAEYVEGDPEEYFLPLGFATGKDRENLQQRSPGSIITPLRLESQNIEGMLYDAVESTGFCRSLVAAIGRRRSYTNGEGELKALATSAWRTFGANQTVSDDSISKIQQSNTALVIGHKYFLKVFRRMEPGPNPDLELGRLLTEKEFPAIAPVAGALKYMRANGEEFTVGLLTRFLPEAKNAWEYTIDALGRYFERIGTALNQPKFAAPAAGPPIGFNQEPVPETVAVLIGTYLEAARIMGQRTGQLHVALASETDDKDFAPEPFTPFYQRSLFQSMRNLTVHTLLALRKSINRVPEQIRPEAEKVIALESAIVKQFKAVHERGIAGKRIRCHGNLHLGEILYTGKDFLFIDFEGESARPLGERRIKRSPLNDVAAMLRSFEFTTYAALFKQLDLGTLHEERLPQLEPWTGFWYRWVSSVYLNAYLEVVGKTDLLPKSMEELKVLFDVHLLEKAVYEIRYELKHRPSWLKIPFRAIMKLLEPKVTTNPSASPAPH
jgi:maltose alpha-D-glucosyltransferase / alpha-amylase